MKPISKKLPLLFLATLLTFSCKKDEFSNSSTHSVAEWIKVFTGLNALNNSFPQMPIVPADDGGMYVAYRDNQNKAWVIKVNSNGILEWKTALQEVAYNLYADRLSDGSLLVIGDNGEANCFSYKLSSDGKSLTHNSFLASNPWQDTVNTTPKAIYENDDGTIMVLGSIYYSGKPFDDGDNLYSEVIFVSKLAADDLSNIFSENLKFPVPVARHEAIRLQPTGIVSVPGDRYLINGSAFNTRRTNDIVKYSIFTCLADNQGKYDTSQAFRTGVDKLSANHLVDGGCQVTMGPLFQTEADFITWVSPLYFDNPLNSWHSDNRQRIMHFNAEGDPVDTTFFSVPPPPNVPFGTRKLDGGFLLLSALPNVPTTVPTKQISQSINVKDDGTVLQQRSPEGFLNFTFTSVCALADGHYAIAGLVQQAGEAQWQLCIIKTDEDGKY